MNRAGLLAVIMFVASVLSGQTQPAQSPPSQPSAATSQPASAEAEKPPTYVRRLSAGISGSVPFLTLLKDGLLQNKTTTPPLETRFETSTTKRYTGAGAFVQFALFERWSVYMGGIHRIAQFSSNRTYWTGVDNVNTIADERAQTSIVEKTKAHYVDVPLLVRRYNIGRHDYGHRWFVEAGPSVRYAAKVSSTYDRTDSKGNTTIDHGPASGHRKNILGVTAGIGGQFIDPIGIRVIPEVRYTRWFGETFAAAPTGSRRDQAEVVISISF